MHRQLASVSGEGVRCCLDPSVSGVSAVVSTKIKIQVKREGDFFEAYDGDVRVMADALGLTLTARDGRAMCGFVFYRKTATIRALAERGVEVEIVDGEKH